MKKWIKSTFKSYMVRPIIYRSIPRFLIALVLSLLWDRFVNKSGLMKITNFVFPIFGFIFLGLAWFSFLALDGMKIFQSRKKKDEKKTKINYADMSDFMDTEVSYDDLDGKDKSACNLAANLICSLIYFILSFF